MLFLDDFLEMLEELPLELRDRCSELRKLDAQVQSGMACHRKQVADFFPRAASLPENERIAEFERLQSDFLRIRLKAEEKIKISERMQELVEKYVAHLEKEKTAFKLELEGDNPGITEQIEKRFAECMQSMIAMRKEQKKRKNGAVNGTERILPALKTHRTDSMSSFRGQEFSFDDELLMLGGGSGSRSRKGSMLGDELVPSKRRSKGSVQAVSPAASDKSWTPFSSASFTNEQSPAPSLSASSATNGISPMLTMPNFSGPESRHGRPRKLTTRVQEMFKETVQRQRSYHPPPSSAGPLLGSNNHDNDEDSSDGGEDDESKRTWCICKEKSYGNMVACDNEKCPYEWFHYHCVGITAPPRGKWFCPQCSEQINAPSHGLDLNF